MLQYEEKVTLKIKMTNMKKRKIIPYNPKLKQLARNLRNNSTLSEYKFGYFKNRRMD